MAELDKRRKNRVVVEITTNKAITQKQARHLVDDMVKTGKNISPLFVSGWPRFREVSVQALTTKEGERVIVGAASRKAVEYMSQGTPTGRLSAKTGMLNIQNLPRDANSAMQQLLRLYTREEIVAALQFALAAEKLVR